MTIINTLSRTAGHGRRTMGRTWSWILAILITTASAVTVSGQDFTVSSSGAHSMIYDPVTKVSTGFIQISPYTPNVQVTMKMLSSAGTFAGGSPTLTVNTNDFDKTTGKYIVSVELVNLTHACFTISWVNLTTGATSSSEGSGRSALRTADLAFMSPLTLSGGTVSTVQATSGTGSSGSFQDNTTPVPGLAYDNSRRYPDCSPGRVCETAPDSGGGGTISFSRSKLQKMLSKNLASSLGLAIALPLMQTGASVGGVTDPVVRAFTPLTCLNLQPVSFPTTFPNTTRVVTREWDNFNFIGHDSVVGTVLVHENRNYTSTAQLTSQGTGTAPFFPATHQNSLYIVITFADQGKSFFNKDPMISHSDLTSFPPVKKQYTFDHQIIDFFDTTDPNGTPAFVLQPDSFFDDGSYAIDIAITGQSLVAKGGVSGSTRLKWTATAKNTSTTAATAYLGMQASLGSGAIALHSDGDINTPVTIAAGASSMLTGYVDYLPGYGTQYISLTLSSATGQRGYSLFYFTDTTFAKASIHAGSQKDGIDNNLDGVIDDAGETYLTPGAQ